MSLTPIQHGLMNLHGQQMDAWTALCERQQTGENVNLELKRGPRAPMTIVSLLLLSTKQTR